MNRTTLQRILLACAVTSGLTLGACGGGGASAPPDATADATVPDSTAASTGALIAYALAMSPDDRIEPLNLGAGTLQLPSDDHAEPTPII